MKTLNDTILNNIDINNSISIPNKPFVQDSILLEGYIQLSGNLLYFHDDITWNPLSTTSSDCPCKCSFDDSNNFIFLDYLDPRVNVSFNLIDTVSIPDTTLFSGSFLLQRPSNTNSNGYNNDLQLVLHPDPDKQGILGSYCYMDGQRNSIQEVNNEFIFMHNSQNNHILSNCSNISLYSSQNIKIQNSSHLYVFTTKDVDAMYNLNAVNNTIIYQLSDNLSSVDSSFYLNGSKLNGVRNVITIYDRSTIQSSNKITSINNNSSSISSSNTITALNTKHVDVTNSANTFLFNCRSKTDGSTIQCNENILSFIFNTSYISSSNSDIFITNNSSFFLMNSQLRENSTPLRNKIVQNNSFHHLVADRILQSKRRQVQDL